MIRQQSAEGFATVPACVMHFLEQLAFGPRRPTSSVPVRQHEECFVVRQIEAPYDSTADPKRVKVTVTPRDRWFQRLQESLRSGNAMVGGPTICTHRPTARGCLRRLHPWEVARCERRSRPQVFDRDRAWRPALVIREPRKSRGLCAGRCGEIRAQFSRETLLHSLDAGRAEPPCAPEDVNTSA